MEVEPDAQVEGDMDDVGDDGADISGPLELNLGDINMKHTDERLDVCEEDVTFDHGEDQDDAGPAPARGDLFRLPSSHGQHLRQSGERTWTSSRP